jgi:hypothetical protein
MVIVGRVSYSHHAVYKLLDKRAILKAILSAIVASDGRVACLYSVRRGSVSRLSQVLSNPTANTIFQCLLGPSDSLPGWPLLPVRPPSQGGRTSPIRGRCLTLAGGAHTPTSMSRNHLTQNGIFIRLLQAS